ncbi:MAG: valine--tRNA ligase, partial [Planctomycetota bacterium]|nr:valine--tRNA ligase [Planctomycetota bacterium]
MAVTLPTTYDPSAVEEKIYRRWESGGAFASSVRRDRRPYCIVIPPPNVTGVLHIGHALNNTLQDLLIRYHRMKGEEAMWLPGTDHAGIATQNVVEREIYAKEKKTRHDLGREELVRRIWEWREQYGNRIIEQLRRIGCSCDWSRLRFTMDEGLSRAVREVFVRLFNEGLIYRGRYIVNWCPRCRTALADDEVEPRDVRGSLWFIRYPVKGDPSRGLTVATTRPETMLGDTAVAVHPDDGRHRWAVGKRLMLPLMNREIPVVADAAVEKDFGTGAVKVTPAHDRNDFELGRRHGLPEEVVIGEDGIMTGAAGPYRGLDRYEARRRIVEDLGKEGLLEKVEDHAHAVGHCYRCDTVIEPYLSMQWFVKMKPLADLAIRATEERRVVFHPARWEKVYLQWLREVRDWCISRQIWWGHRIPVFYCDEPGCGAMSAEREDISRCPKCGSSRIHQDPDVLDTWFSSALWPFSTLGWPSRTPELEYYYPTDTLVTARGIIYFWVARMVMMGEKFMGREPFRHVYIHGTVLDAQGRIMSKSLGNGIDPLEVVAKYGADALRFCLTHMTTEGQDLRLSMERFEEGRNFANKIWNAARFCLTVLEGRELARLDGPDDLAFEDRWVLSRTYSTLEKAEAELEEFDFHGVCETLYHFFWDEFCACYIELVKERLKKDDGRGGRDAAVARRILAHVLDAS